MKKFFYALLCVITFAALAHAEGTRLYKFDDLQFSIECPSGYTAEKYENTVSVVLSNSANKQNFRPTITISSTPNTNPPIDLDEFFKLILQNFLKDANFNILLAEKIKFKGRDAYQLIYKRTAAPKDAHDNVISTKVRQVYIVDQSRLYAMNYAAAENDYDGYLTAADEIIKSFKIIEETTTTMVGKKNATPDLPDVKF